MFSRIKKYIISGFLMLVFACFVASMLMVIAYAIPNDIVRENIKESAILMARDGYFRKSIKGTTGADIDNFSLSFTLGESIFEGKYSFIEKVMLNPSYEYGVPKYYEVLNAANNVPSDQIYIYGRYWHGLIFFLKVLHIGFSLDEIRKINIVLQMLLLIGVLWYVLKKMNVFYALTYLLLVVFCQPLTMAYSIPYAALYYVILLFSLLVLKLDKEKISWKLFFLLGCVVCFVDLLMFPLVALCVPLFLTINLYGKNLRDDIKKIIGYSISWSTGYLGLWIIKFLLATLFTDENILKDGFESIYHRLTGYQNAEENWTFVWALERNLAEYVKEINAWILCGFLVICSFCFVFCRCNFRKNYIAFVNLFIGLYPFVWCMIVQNHSIEHPGSVYRIFTISIMAVGFMLASSIKTNRCVEGKND